MNDSFRTDVFVRYHPETIAVACIFLAARQIGLPLPSNPPWFEVFGAKQSTLEQISLQILALYKRNKVRKHSMAFCNANQLGNSLATLPFQLT